MTVSLKRSVKSNKDDLIILLTFATFVEIRNIPIMVIRVAVHRACAAKELIGVVLVASLGAQALLSLSNSRCHVLLFYVFVD